MNQVIDMAQLAVVEKLQNIKTAIDDLADVSPLSAQAVLELVKSIDGAGSGLDADLLRGDPPRAFFAGLTADDTADTFETGITITSSSSTSDNWPQQFCEIATIGDSYRKIQFCVGLTGTRIYVRRSLSAGTSWGNWFELAKAENVAEMQTGSITPEPGVSVDRESVVKLNDTVFVGAQFYAPSPTYTLGFVPSEWAPPFGAQGLAVVYQGGAYNVNIQENGAISYVDPITGYIALQSQYSLSQASP